MYEALKIMKIICTDYRIVFLGLIPWGFCMFGSDAKNTQGWTRCVKERKGAAVKMGEVPKAYDGRNQYTRSLACVTRTTRAFRISLRFVNVGKHDLTISSLDGRTDSLV